jgi:threonine synthase
MDTHTAVAYKVYTDYVKETGDKTPTVIASTASAYKFAESVSKAINLPACEDGFAYIKELAASTGVEIPYGLRDLDKKEIRHKGTLDIDQLKTEILECLN